MNNYLTIERWKEYQEQTSNGKPRALLVKALPYVLTRAVALDFGAGALNGVLSVNGVSAICSGSASTVNITGLNIGVDEFDASNFWLGQNMPNPTTGLTNIEYNLPVSGEIKFEIMNLLGQKLISKSENHTAGKHIINLDANKFADGVYYYTVEFNGKRLVKKMVLNK